MIEQMAEAFLNSKYGQDFSSGDVSLVESLDSYIIDNETMTKLVVVDSLQQAVQKIISDNKRGK